MKKTRLLSWAIGILFFFLMVLPTGSVPAMRLASAAINFISPLNCPTTGCAAGQRLNMRVSFDLTSYLVSSADNIQICAYTPINWGVDTFSFNSLGTITSANYTANSTNCAQAPTGYQLSSGVSTALQDQFFGDSLEFAFRIGKNASQNGSVFLRIYENDGTSWIQSDQAFIFVALNAPAQTVCVAENSTICGSNFPCYVNSADDLPGGIGTALKDAVDAVNSNATIQILGNYPIKGQTVIIDKPLSILGIQNAGISSSGYDCSQPMLSLQSNILLQGLQINDGLCTAPNRDLLVINSSLPVNIFSNTLSTGKDAIVIQQSSAEMTIFANNISENFGYAINRLANSGSGSMKVTANNLFNNRSGVQVNCANFGNVDHNYWGYSIQPSIATLNCSYQAGKLLGSPILSNVVTAGVQAQKVTVSSQKTSYFEGQISVSRASSDQDFELYVLNHGSNAASVPFIASGGNNNLVPCSNFYDIFLAAATNSNYSLNLSMKYNLNNACLANVESSTYCGQSNPALYPLWWFDPNQLITSGWDTTGQSPAGNAANGASGQVTTCDTSQKEITVQIDSSGRPGLNNDLTFTPFVVAIIGQPAAALLTNFSAVAGDMKVTLNWQTSSELNTSGFYLQRRLQGTNSFSTISPFISHTGTNTSGETYTFTDTTVTNFNIYDYRLEIVGLDFLSVYSNIVTANPAPPTQTPTITPTATITQTPTTTITPTPTVSPTRTATRTSTYTRTPTRTTYHIPTRAATTYRSPTPTRTSLIAPTRVNRTSTTPTKTTSAATGSTTPPTGNTSNPGNAGYPGPESSSVPDGGYPGPDSSGTVSTSTTGTPDGQKTLQTTSSSIAKTFTTPAPTKKPAANDESRSSNWVYYGLGGVIAVCVLLLIAYVLWKKGLLKLPI